MNFTKEETSLCKQAAEKHRKKVEQGDWIQQNYGKPEIVLVATDYIYEKLHFIHNEYWFPLWTISDCLEFLDEKSYTGRIDFGVSNTKIHIFGHRLHSVNWTDYPSFTGKTPLEACLKAVLAVLEEGK